MATTIPQADVEQHRRPARRPAPRRSARPATRPSTPPQQERSEHHHQRHRERERDHGGGAQRPLVRSGERRCLERQQVAGLGRFVVHDRVEQVTERLACAGDGNRLVRRERPEGPSETAPRASVPRPTASWRQHPADAGMRPRHAGLKGDGALGDHRPRVQPRSAGTALSRLLRRSARRGAARSGTARCRERRRTPTRPR